MNTDIPQLEFEVVLTDWEKEQAEKYIARKLKRANRRDKDRHEAAVNNAKYRHKKDSRHA